MDGREFQVFAPLYQKGDWYFAVFCFGYSWESKSSKFPEDLLISIISKDEAYQRGSRGLIENSLIRAEMQEKMKIRYKD